MRGAFAPIEAITLSGETVLDLQVLQTAATALVQGMLLQSADVHVAHAALTQIGTNSSADQTASQYDSYACKPVYFSIAAMYTYKSCTLSE